MSLLRDDILQPLPGNSKGEDLRYDAVYQKVKDARAEDDDDAPQGEWQRQLKKADFATVLKLTGDALAKKSKDLQLAAWMAEALIRREGFAALPECLKLFHELQLQFWDTLYPELDEDGPEFRATPQEWFSNRCDYLLRRVSLSKKGLNWLKYKESRAVGYEEAATDDEKKARREEAVADGKVTAEEFDEAVEASPKSFYVAAHQNIEAAQEALASLEAFCDEKYGNVSPNFSKLRNILQEVGQTVNILLNKKREKEPDEVPVEESASAESSSSSSEDAPEEASVAVAARTPATASLLEAKPASAEEAFAAAGRLAGYLRSLDPAAVTPYLLTRSLRWGELRSAGDSPDPSLLVAPATEVRQNLKRLYAESNWEELLSAAETAVVSPCGRAWLDLHRYAWRAAGELGYSRVAQAIGSEVKALLADFPSLPTWVLADDTPTANPETRTWIDEHVVGPKLESETPAPIIQVAPVAAESAGNGAADSFETATQLAKSGRLAEAMEVLTRQNSHDHSGRETFLRQLRVSQLCLGTGHSAIAYPILQDLYAEIKRRELLDWESKNFVVQPLALLVQCIDQAGQDIQERSQIYNLLCRLEPAMALRLQKS